MSLSDFISLCKIGEGSYSSVFKVKRISDDKVYALKKVKMNNLKQKEKENALNQVRLLASISNDYIIGYKEAFFDSQSNLLCIVMEFADGGDLQKIIEKRKRTLSWISEKEIWKMIKQVVTGISVLHEMKIIHRDLKSANIFICEGNYKLGDLNVSKLLKKTLAYTQTGTPYYASPEVWKDQPYELKSDIWSIGCIIYELCTFRPPFTANSMQGLYKKVLKGVYTKIPQPYSKDLQVFISRCLKQNPSDRPTAKELLNIIPDQNTDEQVKSTVNLLNTIKLPKNLQQLKEGLPGSNYEDGGSVKVGKEANSRFGFVSQERLKEIVRQKQEEWKGKQYRKITPDLKMHDKHRENRGQSIIVKKNEKTEVLPRLKLHSEPADQILLKEEKIRRIQQYNRPVWWG